LSGLRVARSKPAFQLLDVGCGQRAKGDVNVDLHPEATVHRAADQRVNDDVVLNVRSISNFVKADACILPFGARGFSEIIQFARD
jgi:hypothetical protein